MPTKLSEVWPAIERVARAEGVVHLGASDIDDAHAALFEEWIARGHHASMSYLAKNAAIRTHPRERYPWAKSVIVILVPYSSERPQAPDDALSHRVSRYALGDDYHDVLESILRKMEEAVGGWQLAVGGKSADPALSPSPANRQPPTANPIKTWRYVDTGPLSDRSFAAQAGLGWIGKNGMLIHEDDGSYFFIGTLLTALENDINAATVADRCGTCTRCIDACPTNAILPDRTIDSAQCISYATIEHRGPLDPHVAAHLEGNAFGCDICQEVCPWNRQPLEPHPAFVARDTYRATPVTDLLRFTQADFSTLFRKSAIKRARLDGMQRNVEALTANELRGILTP
jgi:epoxyqueuosine reductase